MIGEVVLLREERKEEPPGHVGRELRSRKVFVERLDVDQGGEDRRAARDRGERLARGLVRRLLPRLRRRGGRLSLAAGERRQDSRGPENEEKREPRPPPRRPVRPFRDRRHVARKKNAG